LGTSSSRFQSFRHAGKLYGHILDPRIGQPAEGVLSTTVLAPTATLADALSTAFYVLGPEKSLEYCGIHPEVSSIILVPSPGKSGCEIITAGLKDGEFHAF
jgi:thiamine biosynthesis lipoprotein